MLSVFLSLLGCMPGGGQLPSQGPVQFQMVLHVDPLIRSAEGVCENPSLVQCGDLQGASFERRTNNLVWLAEDWMSNGRTVDVQMGPDVALAWSGDADVLADLGQETGMGRVVETAEIGRSHLVDMLGRGSATLGVHGHDQMLDPSGLWGDVPGPGGETPCTLSEEDEHAEWVLAEHVAGVDVLAEQLGANLLSLSSHVPRTMAGKVAAATQPDALSDTADRDFPERFRPISLGSGLSGCLSQSMDHPPFEIYSANPDGPLLAGEGPMVVPSVRVVGSMAPHFGMERDGSFEAAHRRLIQLLVNWRYAALVGDAVRPWAYTFHAHLFDLQAGSPDPSKQADRGLNAAVGQSFRGDVEALSAVMDGLAGQRVWNGVVSASGQVGEWRTTDELDVDGSQFSLSVEDQASVFEPDVAPYLPLLSERIENGHYVCDGAFGSAHVYGFERCDAGWSWGQPGYGCSDGEAPSWVGLILSDLDGCISIPGDGLRVAPVDGERFSRPERCTNNGIWVPQKGLIVEASDGAPLPSLCASG